MKNSYKLLIAKDFTKYPGGRYKSEGPHSGEELILNHLMGRLMAAIAKGYKLEIDLTGMNGYPSSFLSGSFGKISYELGLIVGQDEASKILLDHIELRCDDSQTRIKAVMDEITNPITKAEKKNT